MILALRHRKTFGFVARVIMLLILFIGIKVPNLSHPQKSKSSQRAILETATGKYSEPAPSKHFADPFEHEQHFPCCTQPLISYLSFPAALSPVVLKESRQLCSRAPPKPFPFA